MARGTPQGLISILVLAAVIGIATLCYPSLVPLAAQAPPPSTRKQVKKRPVKKPENTRRIPNVLVAGAQKAGTTFVSSWLAMRDDVCFPKPVDGATEFPDTSPKELHYFDRADRYVWGIDFFRSRWEHCGTTPYIIDGTPNYLRVPRRVKETYEEQGTADKLRIIIILREPVSREVSRYQMMVRIHTRGDRQHEALEKDGEGGGEDVRSFKEYVNVTFPATIWEDGRPSEPKLRQYTGVYVAHLKEWFAAFDRKQILLLSFDELKINPQKFFGRIHRFLGFSGNVTAFGEDAGRQNSGSTSDAKPPCSVQKELGQLFQPYNEELYTLLDKNPGPKMEERPFPRFKAPCADEESA